MRAAILGLIALGLAVAVFLAWPRTAAEEPKGTNAASAEASTTTRPDPTTSLATSTIVDDSHVVETVEEAEEILRELWFGWFEGIYNQDEDRIREVVGNPDLVDAAVSQFGVMEFESRPSRGLIVLRETDILLSDETCLAVWSVVDATQIIGASNRGVFVFVWSGSSWYFVSSWAYKEDLWEDDCYAQLLP